MLYRCGCLSLQSLIMQETEESSSCLLHQAAIYDNVDLLASLLEGDERKSIDMRDMFGRTPLYTAVTNDAFKCAHLLLCTGGKALKCTSLLQTYNIPGPSSGFCQLSLTIREWVQNGVCNSKAPLCAILLTDQFWSSSSSCVLDDSGERVTTT